jgi:uncharacterized iron-regulated membrane protein
LEYLKTEIFSMFSVLIAAKAAIACPQFRSGNFLMADTRTAQLRRLWRNVHLWTGAGLALLLIPISLSGGLLVWHDQIDSVLNPRRYAVTGAEVSQPPTTYLTKAADATANTDAGLRPAAMRYPEPGWPVQVTMRVQPRDDGGRPRTAIVFLDPPTGAVLDVMDFRSSLIGFLHGFHENLTLPQYSGRQIIGWVGIGMLTLSLTGIWLWWPRASGFLHGLRWARSPRFTFNLHHLLGFWISIPLAVVSSTGIYLAFPQTAREVTSSVATMNQQGPRGFGEVARQTTLTPDHVLDIARQAELNAKPLMLFLPVQQRGERSPAWRVQMSRIDSGEVVTVMVDDRSGRAAPTIAPQAGDRAASWIRWIHEGSHSGPVWAVIVFLTGTFPTIFAVTGATMWLRKRADRKVLQGKRGAAQLRPAE